MARVSSPREVPSSSPGNPRRAIVNVGSNDNQTPLAETPGEGETRNNVDTNELKDKRTKQKQYEAALSSQRASGTSEQPSSEPASAAHARLCKCRSLRSKTSRVLPLLLATPPLLPCFFSFLTAYIFVPSRSVVPSFSLCGSPHSHHYHHAPFDSRKRGEVAAALPSPPSRKKEKGRRRVFLLSFGVTPPRSFDTILPERAVTSPPPSSPRPLPAYPVRLLLSLNGPHDNSVVFRYWRCVSAVFRLFPLSLATSPLLRSVKPRPSLSGQITAPSTPLRCA